jgi:putative lipoprotein
MTAVVAAGAGIAGISMLNAGGGSGPGLDNTSWVMEALNGEALPPVPEGTARVPGIEFGEGGRFSATAGCNMMNGTAEISGAAISFPEQMASTMMACPPPLDEAERALSEALGAAAELRMEDGRLLILNSEGAEVIGLAAAP